MPPSITTPTAPSTPSQYGGYSSSDQLASDVKSGNLSVNKLAQNNKTSFQWQPQDSQYWSVRGNFNPTVPPPPLNKRKLGSFPTPATGRGAVAYRSPIQLKEAVKLLSAQSMEKLSLADSLEPESKKTYLERMDEAEKRGPFITGAKILGGRASEVVGFATKAAQFAKSKLTGQPTYNQQNNMMEQKIQDLNRQADEQSSQPLRDQARKLHDAYMANKIKNMSEDELFKMNAEHPAIADMAQFAAVSTIQYVLLMNAPFIKQLGTYILHGAKGKGGAAAAAASIKYTSPFVRSLAKMTATLAADVPIVSVQSVLNFDYENRPLTELPAQFLKDAAILLPTALVFHSGLYLGAAALGTTARVASPMVIQAAARIIGMMKSLRLPISKGSADALESAVMNEADNAFTRILQAFPEDQAVLQQHFQTKRQNSFLEDRMLQQNPEGSPAVSTKENRLAGLTGKIDPDVPSFPDPGPSGKLDEGALVMSELKEVTKRGRMRDSLRGFSLGIARGEAITKDGIKRYQSIIESFIKEQLPPDLRSRALPLIKRSNSPNALQKSLDSLMNIVDDIDRAALMKEDKALLRKAEAALDIASFAGAPDVDLVTSHTNPSWLDPVLRGGAGAVNFTKKLLGREKAFDLDTANLVDFSQSAKDQFLPFKDLRNTYAYMVQSSKIISNEQDAAIKVINTMFTSNFKDVLEERQFVKYAYLRFMKQRAEDGISNPGSIEFRIDDNPTLEWINQAIAQLDSPKYQNIFQQKQAIQNMTLDNNVKAGHLTQAVADELKLKNSDYAHFSYLKYTKNTDGNPHNTKSWNYPTSPDSMKKIVGGEGQELKTNLYSDLVNASNQSIADKHSSAIASLMREEAGIKPLKIIEDVKGGRTYQAIVDGNPYQFDEQDLQGDLIKGLEGQRVLYSTYDKQAFLVPKKWYESITSQEEKLSKLLSTIKAITREGQYYTTTSRTSFLPSNFVKDYATSMTFTKSDVADFVIESANILPNLAAGYLKKGVENMETSKLFNMTEDVALNVKKPVQKAMDWLAKKIGTKGWDQTAQDIIDSGADQGTMFSQIMSKENGVRDYLLSDIDPKFSKHFLGVSAARFSTGIIALKYRTVAALSGAIEMFARSTEFALSMKATGGNKLLSGADASAITLDHFSKGTSKLITPSKAFLPFWYTSEIKGPMRFLSMIMGREQRYVKGGGGALRPYTPMEIVGRMMVRPLLLNLTTYKMLVRSGVYPYISSELRKGYWNFPTGRTYKDEHGNTNPVIASIRKNEEDQIFSAIFDAYIDTVVTKNPEAMNNLVGSSSIIGVASLAGWMRLFFEIPADRQTFRGTSINPAYIQKRPFELQYMTNTTPVGKFIGDAMGIGGNKGDYILRTATPAIYDDLKYFLKLRSGKPDWIALGEYLKVINVPKAFFTDQDLSKQRKGLEEEMKSGDRSPVGTKEERKNAIERIRDQIDAIDKIVKWRRSMMKETPLQGKMIEFQKNKKVDMNLVKTFLATGPGNRQTAIYNAMSPEEKQAAKDEVARRKQPVDPLRK